FSAKFIGKRYGFKGNGGKNIKIIEKVALSQDKLLIIVKVADKTMLLGVTNNKIEKISDVDELSLNVEEPNDKNMDFLSILKNVTNSKFSILNKEKENLEKEKDD
ncbi:MAG TPA: flagellar biosynthetic protein FliO, partial [Clostridiales bacterium]|nr:flagellar biosynthetic protein FliO [Clostridiales bacterium]